MLQLIQLLGTTGCSLGRARRLQQVPELRAVFFKADGAGGFRPPAVNETCCVRTALADLLDEVGAQVRSRVSLHVTPEPALMHAGSLAAFPAAHEEALKDWAYDL